MGSVASAGSNSGLLQLNSRGMNHAGYVGARCEVETGDFSCTLFGVGTFCCPAPPVFDHAPSFAPTDFNGAWGQQRLAFYVNIFYTRDIGNDHPANFVAYTLVKPLK
jgi:hypothetical protein